MVNVMGIRVDGKDCMGILVRLPESPPLILIKAEKGLVACGFLSIEAAEKLGAAVATVSGVKSFEDVLSAQIRAVTPRARSFGVEVGMKGADALKHLS